MIKAKDAKIISKPSDIQLIPGMRNIKFLGIHCTSAPQNQLLQETLNYWERHNKWSKPGYHFMITADGVIHQLVPINELSNGIKDWNSNLINICCTGGINAKGQPFDNRTNAQKASLVMLIKRFLELLPNIITKGHRDFSTDKNGNGIIESWEWIKACPSYDVAEWAESIGLDLTPSKIVYKLNTPLIKNEKVKVIQKALKIKVDGIFGADTEAAVKKFQSAMQLTPDGIVGELTASMLGFKL